MGSLELKSDVSRDERSVGYDREKSLGYNEDPHLLHQELLTIQQSTFDKWMRPVELTEIWVVGRDYDLKEVRHLHRHFLDMKSSYNHIIGWNQTYVIFIQDAQDCGKIVLDLRHRCDQRLKRTSTAINELGINLESRSHLILSNFLICWRGLLFQMMRFDVLSPNLSKVFNWIVLSCSGCHKLC